MSNILHTIATILRDSLLGVPTAPANIRSLQNRVSDLMDVSLDATGDGIRRWLIKFHEIANDKTLRETLLVRALQMHLPRVAETFTLLSIIEIDWENDNTPKSFSINWNNFNLFINEPGDNF
ncbi:MAG: hypothetical protein J7527_06985 [Chitinophagaceae bacterium]|nr:hypothetical protein [Chitinophagaceae bacterium]